MWVRLFSSKHSKLLPLGHSDPVVEIQAQAESVEIVGSIVIFRGTALTKRQASDGASSGQSGLAS